MEPCQGVPASQQMIVTTGEFGCDLEAQRGLSLPTRVLELDDRYPSTQSLVIRSQAAPASHRTSASSSLGGTFLSYTHTN